MNQQELQVGDNVIIKSEEELIEFYKKLKDAGDSIDEELINDWLERTNNFRGKVIEIIHKSYRYGYEGRILYQGKHGLMDYCFYSEELIKVNIPRNK